MTIDVADIALLRRNHRSDDAFLRRCYTCYQKWPCITTELLDAYEEREQFNKTLAAVCDTVIELQTERDRLRGDVQTTINEWGHASHCELYVSQNNIPSACDCIIGDLKRALEGRE